MGICLRLVVVGLGLERRRIREKLGLFRGCVNSIMNKNPRKKEEKIKKREKEKEITRANVPIAQNTQFY